MGIIRFGLGLILLLVIILYSVQNLSPVTIVYYNHLLDLKTIEVPVIVLIFSSVFIGFFLACLVNFSKIWALKSISRRQRREINKLLRISEKKDGKIAALSTPSKTGPQ